MEFFAPRRILVGTDFSDLSAWALRHAVMWAQRFDAHLTVLNVQEIPWMTGDLWSGAYNLEELMQAGREAASQQMEECVKQYIPPGLPVSSAITHGVPAPVLEEHVRSGQIDLLVLGTHGRGGLSRLLLGSVAERTLRLAQHPTLVVRQLATRQGAEGEAPKLSHVLCPVNYTDVGQAAFEHACSVARAFDARLAAVRVVGQEKESPESLQSAQELLQAWLPEAATRGYPVEAVVRHGNAAEQVISLAQEAGVDLIVVGALHRPFGESTVLGVTTVRVTRHAPCPVLVVPRSSGASRESP
jgi:nucleotide-binding universal stress UspA family protein